MSARSGNCGKASAWRLLRFAALLVSGTALLAACGSSGPREPAADGTEILIPPPSVTAADTAAEQPDAEAERESRRQDRRARRQREDADAAEEAGDAVLTEVPERAAESYARALNAMTAGNWAEAELELEQLILEYDGFAGPWVNLAIIYRRDGREDEARSALEHALELAPDHPAANNELGILLREQGRFDAAEAAYRRAIEADPGYSLPYYNLGVLLDLYLRREAEALEAYEAYQSARGERDELVGRWIIDLRRRLGITDQTARVAPAEGP